MAFDLFFYPKGADPKKAARKDYVPTKAVERSQAALHEAIQAKFKGARLVSSSTQPGQGHFEDFPSGSLDVRPGELYWSLHGGDYDMDAIQRVVTWFESQGCRCVDPQDAGFTTPEKAKKPRPASRMMKTWDELHGSRFVEWSRDDVEGEATLIFDFPDGRRARCVICALQSIEVPAGASGTVTDVQVTTGHFDNHRIILDPAAVIEIVGIHKVSKIEDAS
ncbi:MAG: hypothetical protein JNM76_06480 [Betaproteobacteria bacterium]|nr:hypothetical protein [Betaproteobacteria bacterium]